MDAPKHEGEKKRGEELEGELDEELDEELEAVL